MNVKRIIVKRMDRKSFFLFSFPVDLPSKDQLLQYCIPVAYCIISEIDDTLIIDSDVLRPTYHINNNTNLLFRNKLFLWTQTILELELLYDV